MAKTAQKNYDVYAKIIIESSISIKADSFEDALSQAKQLEETDFVEIKEEFNDRSIVLQGLFLGD